MAKSCLATLKVSGNTVTADVTAQNTGDTTLSDMTIECSLKPPIGAEIQYKTASMTNVSPQALMTRSFPWDIDQTYTQAGVWTVYARLYINSGVSATATEYCTFTLQIGTPVGRLVGVDIQPRGDVPPFVYEGYPVTASCAVQNIGTVSGDLLLKIRWYKQDGSLIKTNTNLFTLSAGQTSEEFLSVHNPTNANTTSSLYAICSVYSGDGNTLYESQQTLTMQVAKSGEAECVMWYIATNPSGDVVSKGQTLTADGKFGNEGDVEAMLTFEILFTDSNGNNLKDEFKQGYYPPSYSNTFSSSYTIPSNYSLPYVNVHFIGKHQDNSNIGRKDFEYVKKLMVQ